MDQTCARVSALQLARLEESSRRVATGLRGVEPEENRGPEHRLIPKKKAHNPFSGRKTKPPTVHHHLLCRIKSTTLAHTFLWDKLLGLMLPPAATSAPAISGFTSAWAPRKRRR